MSKSSRESFKSRRNADQREMSALRKKAGLTYSAGKIDPETIAARLAEIPADTRSFTARVFGDPLPGRSALDRQHRI